MTDTPAPRRPGILPMLTLNDLTRENIKRECAGPSEIETDDQGNDFERCPDNDHGHLYHRDIPYCLHCFLPRPEERGC